MQAQDPKKTIHIEREEVPDPDEPVISSNRSVTNLDLFNLIHVMRKEARTENQDRKREIKQMLGRLDKLEAIPLVTDVPAEPVSLTSPPVANPEDAHDVMIPVRPRMPSVNDDVPRTTPADAQDSVRYRSLAERVDELTSEVRATRKQAPVAATQAVTTAAAAAGIAASSATVQVLTSKNFTNMVYMIATLAIGAIGSGAWTAHQAHQGAREAGQETASSVEHAIKENTDAKGPNVFIVHDAPIASSPIQNKELK